MTRVLGCTYAQDGIQMQCNVIDAHFVKSDGQLKLLLSLTHTNKRTWRTCTQTCVDASSSVPIGDVVKFVHIYTGYDDQAISSDAES